MVTPSGGADVPGSGTSGTSGVSICQASHGNAAANARAANGQSCRPLCGITAQSIPFWLPRRHSARAASVGLLSGERTSGVSCRPAPEMAGILAFSDTANQPATPS